MTPTTTMPDTNPPIKGFQESAIRAQEQADCDMRLTAYKAELIEKIEGKRRSEDEAIGNDDWSGNYNEALDDVLVIIKEK